MRLLLLALALAGCPRPIPPPPYVPAAPVCPGDLSVSQAGLCTNAFTPDGLACVACSGAVPDGGCFLSGPAIYCVQACFDPICGVRAGGARR